MTCTGIAPSHARASSCWQVPLGLAALVVNLVYLAPSESASGSSTQPRIRPSAQPHAWFPEPTSTSIVLRAPSQRARPLSHEPHEMLPPIFLPAVYLLGEQKASSTSLFMLLRQIPDLCGGFGAVAFGPPPYKNKTLKELHFWNNEQRMFSHERKEDPNNKLNWSSNPSSASASAVLRALSEESLKYFGDTFKRCLPKQGAPQTRLTLDGTPNYLLGDPYAWERNSVDRLFNRMARTYARHGNGALPKFIVIIREPVSRSLSWFNHDNREKGGAVKLDLFPCTLDGANYTRFVRCRKEGSHTLVGEALQRVVNHFGRERLLVLTAPHLHTDTAGSMRAVAAFLGVPLPSRMNKRLTLPRSNERHGASSVTIDQVPCRMLRWHRSVFADDQARLETLASGPGRPKMQPPYVRPVMPETQRCLLNNGTVGTVGPMVRLG